MKKESTQPKEINANQAQAERDFVKKRVTVSPVVMNASVIADFTKEFKKYISVSDIIDGLNETVQGVNQGDMKVVEDMLISQANALQAVFVNLIRSGEKYDMLASYEIIMRLALRAQNQSRATLQTLIELKYPRQATFVRQANIANGHQQVNNGHVEPVDASHTDTNISEPNKLLEELHHERLDTRTTKAASSVNQDMATVAAQHRRKNRRRQGESSA